MYGGDEIGAVVIDAGTCWTKAGYAGDDSPKHVIPSNVGVYTTGSDNTVGSGPKSIEDDNATPMDLDKPSKKVHYVLGTNGLSHCRDYMEVKNPMEKGLINDWDLMEQLWSHTFQSLRIDPTTTPILLSEPSYNTNAIREKVTEIFFEKFKVPALFVSKNAVLSSFANGKQSSLVIDCGGGSTCVTPVYDGYALQRCIFKSNVAGNLLTEEYYKALTTKQNIKIRPHYQIKKKEFRPGEFEVELKDLPNVSESYHIYSVKNIVRDIKETVCRIADTTFDENANMNIPGIPYELPDGQHIEVGTDRFKMPEYIFNPSPLNQLKREGEEDQLGLAQMVYNSIAKSDAEIRRELMMSIILTGGTSLIPNFTERLFKELHEKAGSLFKVKVLASNTPAERKYSVFIGGSILGSLGTFHQMWISKDNYEEFGKEVVDKKCP